mgnify:CR=1 FL=1
MLLPFLLTSCLIMICVIVMRIVFGKDGGIDRVLQCVHTKPAATLSTQAAVLL